MRRFLFIDGNKPSEVLDAFDQVVNVGDYIMHEGTFSSSLYRRVVRVVDIVDRNNSGDIYETWGKTRYVKLLCEPVPSLLDDSSTKMTYLEDQDKIIKLSDEQLKSIKVRKHD